MNNLRLWRESRGLKQTELAAMVKPIDARIDSSMISRFENEMCLPTPSVSKALASALNVPESLLFGGTEQMYIAGVVDGEARTEPESMDVTDLIAHFRERGGGGPAGQAGAYDDDGEFPFVGRIDELGVHLVLGPFLFKRAGRDFAVEDHGCGWLGIGESGNQRPKPKTRMAMGMETKPTKMNTL